MHAFLLAQDYKLVAAGVAAEDEGQGARGPGEWGQGGSLDCKMQRALVDVAVLSGASRDSNLSCGTESQALAHPLPRTLPRLRPAADFAAPREEVGTEGWDALPGAYAFRYQDVAGRCRRRRKTLLHVAGL